ncbi:hypothetical protein ACFY1U_48060 [Streptomyces sp. NPDC001351]
MPGSEQHRCGFSPGWSIRAYADTLTRTATGLFESLGLQRAGVRPSP